jgi:thiol-disulfide isomerase/thioredoxin
MRAVSLFLIALCISNVLKSQEINKEVSVNGTPFLIGRISPEAISQKPYGIWFTPNFENYTVDMATISKFKNELKNYQILIFLGTWCGDSKREVPRFLKILDIANFPDKNLKIVALDSRKEHYKKSPTGEEWGLNIQRVPTFIFYKNGKEINRIIETPNTKLEEDILAILTTDSYVAHKAKSMHFD